MELIFIGAYYWKEICVSKWVGLDNKNSIKHYENSLKQLALTIHGLIFGRAYYQKDWGAYFQEGLFIYLFIIIIIIFWGGGGLLSEFYGILVPSQ